jgi:hypothetical protein
MLLLVMEVRDFPVRYFSVTAPLKTEKIIWETYDDNDQ